MNDRLEMLKQWMDAPEDEHLEFKEAKTRFDFEKLVKYCCAMANEGGGKIILGVTDKRPHRVVGSRAHVEATKTQAAILDRLKLIRVDAEEIEHDGGRVVTFHVPSRPRGRSYIRRSPARWAGRTLGGG